MSLCNITKVQLRNMTRVLTYFIPNKYDHSGF
jgi:hypothetical protein